MLEPDNIAELDWVSVPNAPYVMKYIFHDSGYIIIFSNLTSIYEEKLTDSDIEARFNAINSFVKMKPRVIIDNLKKSLENCLMDKSDISLKLDGNRTTITLTFSVGSVLCNYDVQMNLMPADKVMQYIIGPTVLGALLSQRKVLELQKKIVSSGNTKSSSPAKIVSTQNVIEPGWLKGKNVSTKLICDSFLEIQNHFKDLSAENYEAYSASKKIRTENASKIPHASPPKKYKLLENKNECRVNFVDEDDEYKLVKKAEPTTREQNPVISLDVDVRKGPKSSTSGSRRKNQSKIKRKAKVKKEIELVDIPEDNDLIVNPCVSTFQDSNSQSGNSAAGSDSNKGSTDTQLPPPNVQYSEITNMADLDGILFFLMKRNGSDKIDLVPAKAANERHPQVVIKFYETRILDPSNTSLMRS